MLSHSCLSLISISTILNPKDTSLAPLPSLFHHLKPPLPHHPGHHPPPWNTSKPTKPSSTCDSHAWFYFSSSMIPSIAYVVRYTSIISPHTLVLRTTLPVYANTRSASDHTCPRPKVQTIVIIDSNDYACLILKKETISSFNHIPTI